MNAQDRQLWKSIRNALAYAQKDSEHRMVSRLFQPEFDLLYGEVNAKCSEQTAHEPEPFEYATNLETSKQEARRQLGQEPDAQVLRHADIIEKMNADIEQARKPGGHLHLKGGAEWTADEILKRES